MPGFLQEHTVRLLPYPDGKTFAFTIIDDTDGGTLEIVRPIYERLFQLGMRTTKTVWIMRPSTAPDRSADAGDTLEREEYADYMRLLQRRGFEIALHNVSSKSNTRPRIASGIERFRDMFGSYPRINVQHEKNLENIYFGFAQSPGHLPPPFRTVVFRLLHSLLRDSSNAAPPNYGCSGEDPSTEYFWGDICRSAVKYVRSNVFFPELNTLECNPEMPYASGDTPYVNYWFDSSNGQDAATFNALLDGRNIARLRSGCGCSIVYTHFGKGFVEACNGAAELNAETGRRLQAIAGHREGWYVPASDLLDRLLAFQSVTGTPLGGGFAVVNGNPYAVSSITLKAKPDTTYSDLSGRRFAADDSGTMVIPSLAPGGVIVLTPAEARVRTQCWYEQCGPAWLADMRTAAGKVRTRLSHYARKRY